MLSVLNYKRVTPARLNPSALFEVLGADALRKVPRIRHCVGKIDVLLPDPLRFVKAVIHHSVNLKPRLYDSRASSLRPFRKERWSSMACYMRKF